MNSSIILLRIIHIVCGAFWVGAVFMTVLFLMKALADVGPTGGQVMGALVKRRYFDFLPAIALVTVLSGIELLRRVSGGVTSEYMGSRAGMVMSVGALAGFVALVIGVVVSRPSTLGAVALMGKASSMLDGPEKGALMGQIAARRARGAMSLRIVAGLLFIAVLCMAAARYA
ncbi:MAG: hypothetical protein H7066_17075 [Cytophagaceae bacterium]|nr:hypothetical protein [Gemmatimonadaceae bacterium]